jgi:hypothetical protein
MDDLSPFVADVTTIPDQFLRFIPHNSGFSTGLPYWIVTKDDSLQCIDVQRQKLVPVPKVFSIGVL